MIHYFVSKSFALFPRKLTSGQFIWLRSFYVVEQYLDGYGDLLVTRERYSSISEKDADLYRQHLETTELIVTAPSTEVVS